MMSDSIYPAWFVVKSKHNQEKRAESQLISQGVKCYLPVIPISSMRDGKKQHLIRDDILFPGYLFAFFDPEIIHTTEVKNTRGISGLVNFGGTPAIISESDMCDIRARIDERAAALTAKSIPARGECIEITSGAFEALEAVYEEPDGLRRSMVLINVLGKQVRRSVCNKEFRFA
ncbi:transcription/translation regulatory transformer protein RfaH [Candidatus Symbiopectobacterium sp. 'North America']|uniref:transcription/translation regulatory transformer protein RfaH n=1 Tax=Candidatus Symbiopectobacterium sp. 'North America' TaxID=2794574 RepID=UPI0018CAE685|nr:transcription/translation regulatory transformer protein RfaH [Candidatus Symbiopectobacterium sp. 'North America']